MSDVAKEAWTKYLIQLHVHPLRTKAITSGVLSGSIEALSQKISGVKKLQLKRLFLIMLFGFVYGGPSGHFLNKLVDKIFKGKDNKTTVKKLLLEQLIFSPWDNFVFMLYYGLVVQGQPWSLVKNKLQKEFPAVQLASWKVWPTVSWVAFRYVPQQFRVLFYSLVGACWAIFLNLKAASGAIKKN